MARIGLGTKGRRVGLIPDSPNMSAINAAARQAVDARVPDPAEASEGDVLTVDNEGRAEWVAPPSTGAVGARVRSLNPTGQSMSHGQTTVAEFSDVLFDTDEMLQNDDRLVAPGIQTSGGSLAVFGVHFAMALTARLS